MSGKQVVEVEEGGDVVMVLSDVVVNCSGCGDEVQLLEEELVDGRAPKNYKCAECA